MLQIAFAKGYVPNNVNPEHANTLMDHVRVSD
jgi:hypothetical protein